MPGAKTGLVDYIFKNNFEKAKKISSYDKHFVVATKSKLRDSFKQFVEHGPLALQKLLSVLKQSSPKEKLMKPFAPQTPKSKSNKFQMKNKLIALHSLYSNNSPSILSLIYTFT